MNTFHTQKSHHENDHVVVMPTADTVQLMSDIFSSCPFDHQPAETWHVTVFVGQSPLTPTVLRPTDLYFAIGERLDMWYDSELQRTNLVLVLDSEALVRRHTEIEQETGVPSQYKDAYVPHLTIVYGLPPLSQSIKSFINSVTMSFRRWGATDPLKFTGEMLLDSNGYTPNIEGMKHFEKRGI